jgi:transglutaminase-like putative cysteine protease
MFLVKNSNDPDVGRYVLANLQHAPNSLDCPQVTAGNIRAEAQIQLWGICSQNPAFLNRPKDETPLQKALDNLRTDYRNPWTQLATKRIEFFQGLADKQREAAKKIQMEAMTQQVRKAIKQQEEMAGIWRNLMSLDDAILIRKMKHPDLVVSVLAIQAVGKKRVPAEKECIALLASPIPTVRQAARQTLIRLGRGVDFGPEPTATPLQIAQAAKSWSNWAAIQTPEPAEAVAAKTRRVEFTYAGTVKDLKPGTLARVWLPMPNPGPDQDLVVEDETFPAEVSVGSEKQYGNKMFYFEAKADAKGEIPFEIVYRIRRKEIKTDFAANVFVKPAAEENLQRYMQADAKVPIDGKPLDLLKDRKLPADQHAAARVLYDFVNGHMKYGKTGAGWGQGDALWACDSKFGNCTDFHSLFIAMARGNKIPAKLEIGFSIPAKRGEGDIAGYHCWAWFLPDGKGWVPVDIAEANRNPELTDYCFGNLSEDRVRFSVGRDIHLEPRQKGPALNFFMDPYVEVDGAAYPLEKIERRFKYKDIP